MILTGGSSSRFGSDKSSILFAGETLVNRLLRTLPAGPIVIVGPQFDQSARTALFAQENPPGGGPVAAIHAGLMGVSTEFVAIIATDMPFAAEVISSLIARTCLSDALLPLDESKQAQLLCGLYRSDSLREAIVRLGNPANKSMRALIAGLTIETLVINPHSTTKLLDIDTQTDFIYALDLYEREAGEE